uniref:Uncharacterized protein n=1 Tax=Anguilla anguilla TaxID=7936 RepID=A0A0E9XZG5_ANGAN
MWSELCAGGLIVSETL